MNLHLTSKERREINKILYIQQNGEEEEGTCKVK